MDIAKTACFIKELKIMACHVDQINVVLDNAFSLMVHVLNV